MCRDLELEPKVDKKISSGHSGGYGAKKRECESRSDTRRSKGHLCICIMKRRSLEREGKTLSVDIRDPKVVLRMNGYKGLDIYTSKKESERGVKVSQG